MADINTAIVNLEEAIEFTDLIIANVVTTAANNTATVQSDVDQNESDSDAAVAAVAASAQAADVVLNDAITATDVNSLVRDVSILNDVSQNKNATDIGTNDTDIAQNATDIGTNDTDIAQNATDIARIDSYDTHAKNVTDLGGLSIGNHYPSHR